MTFIKRNEKRFVKSLIYGFFTGLFLAILFMPQGRIEYNADAQTIGSTADPIFQYIISALQVSVIVSVTVLIMTIIYSFMKQYKRK